jgi:hypothetical protein
MIIIYVDGTIVLMQADCIYVPYFARDDESAEEPGT